MTVFKVKNSPYYQFDFRRNGRRHSGSTKCLKRADAEEFENAKIQSVERQAEILMLAGKLPRHVVREPFGGGWRYYFVVPSKARKAGCPIKSECLGSSLEEATARAEDVLLPAYRAWLSEKGKAGSDIGSTEQPDSGVYLLLLKGKVAYVGSSRHMSKRVAQHRSGSRPFDQAYFIPAPETERQRLEGILIRAIQPHQNRIHRVPDKSLDTSKHDPLSY